MAMEVKFGSTRRDIAAQERLKQEYAGVSVLWGEIGAEAMSYGNIPVVLVLSPGATAAYKADKFAFSGYNILPEEGHFIISETGTDSLAILRVVQDQVEVKGKNINEWLPVNFKNQRLGLAIITAKEGKNSMARYWATAFVFNNQ